MKCTDTGVARVGFVTVLSGDLVVPSHLRFRPIVSGDRYGHSAALAPDRTLPRCHRATVSAQRREPAVPA